MEKFRTFMIIITGLLMVSVLLAGIALIVALGINMYEYGGWPAIAILAGTLLFGGLWSLGMTIAFK